MGEYGLYPPVLVPIAGGGGDQTDGKLHRFRYRPGRVLQTV
jgi:hypothetical protein